MEVAPHGQRAAAAAFHGQRGATFLRLWRLRRFPLLGAALFALLLFDDHFAHVDRAVSPVAPPGGCRILVRPLLGLGSLRLGDGAGALPFHLLCAYLRALLRMLEPHVRELRGAAHVADTRRHERARLELPRTFIERFILFPELLDHRGDTFWRLEHAYEVLLAHRHFVPEDHVHRHLEGRFVRGWQLHVNIRAVLNAQLGAQRVLLADRGLQGGAAVDTRLVHVCAILEQQAHALGVVLRARNV